MFDNDLEGTRNLTQKDCTKTCSSSFVPIRRVVQVADRPGVELDSQALTRSQSKLDSSAHFRPILQLCCSADDLARAAIKLFEPCRCCIGIFGFIEALNKFRCQPRAFVSGQLQELGKNFATISHR
jgi:hypothetical protein